MIQHIKKPKHISSSSLSLLSSLSSLLLLFVIVFMLIFRTRESSLNSEEGRNFEEFLYETVNYNSKNNTNKNRLPTPTGDIPIIDKESNDVTMTEIDELLKNCIKAQSGHKPINDDNLLKLSILNKVPGLNSNMTIIHAMNLSRLEKRNAFHVLWNTNEKFIVESNEKPAINSSDYLLHPRRKVSKTIQLQLNPSLFQCHGQTEQLCLNKTLKYRKQIIKNFQEHLKNTIHEENQYNVQYKPDDFHNNKTKMENYPTTCLLIDANVRLLKRKDLMKIKNINKSLDRKLLTKQKLFPLKRNKIKTCAIVSSAGSMFGSKLGQFIDSHDIVMRFNNAPTKDYETDVGHRTTIRVVNSQVVTKPQFEFTSSKIFQNVSIVAWDPSKYNSTLDDWLNNCDYNLFTNYEIYRRKYRKSRIFLLDPRSIWRLWQNLQIFTGNQSIRKNPPSSGFIGLGLLLPYCPVINFIEYFPSTRLNGRCHYYGKEIDASCTFGSWHPLAAEKLMVLNMNIANDTTVLQNGILRIEQPDKHLCQKI